MKKRFIEESLIFINILKWFILATLIGIIVGLAITFFIKTLDFTTTKTTQLSYYIFLLPIGLFLSSLITKHIAPDAAGHGTEKVIEAIHKYAGKIPLFIAPVKFITTVITIAAGGSVGKEGPCAQIGGSLSSFCADVLKLNEADRRTLVICGISAGFAAVFGTPIAGAIFGVEVLFVGTILYEVLLPSFVAGITAFQVSTFFGISYFRLPINSLPVFDEYLLLKVIGAGIFFGLCSFLLILILRGMNKLADKVTIWPPLKGLIGGFVLIGLTLITSKDYLGLGLDKVYALLHGGTISSFGFILKMIFTSITLSFGGSGGIIAPIFFIGASAGNFFASIFHLNTILFTAIGLVALLAGAANTPISASILAIELFGAPIAPFAAIACVISFLMTGHRSVYPSQLLTMTKASRLQVELGKEIKYVQAKIKKK